MALMDLGVGDVHIKSGAMLEPIDPRDVLAPFGCVACGSTKGYERRHPQRCVACKAPYFLPLPNVMAADKIRKVPRGALHPALTAPLSGHYGGPPYQDGWIGWIEDGAKTWVAFVSEDGSALLWTKRDRSGGAVGKPYRFNRPDLAIKPSRIEPSKRPRSPSSAATSRRRERRGILDLPVRSLPQ